MSDLSSLAASMPIYLDNHASTACDPRVLEAMLPFFGECFANPSSQLHKPGKLAADAVSESRNRVAEAIGASSSEVVFTSGATESNNLAVIGSARAAPKSRRRILVSAIEHKCVIRAATHLQAEGFEVGTIPVTAQGVIDLGVLRSMLDERVCLVSIQAASNEIGTIQQIDELAQIIHSVGAKFHCDGAQALGRMPIDLQGSWNADLLSLSAHKCYGPKGVGALFVRGGARTASLIPLMFGGGQEWEIRPGTSNVPGIVGFGVAATLAAEMHRSDEERIGRLRDKLEGLIVSAIENVRINGYVPSRLSGNSSMTFAGADSEAVIANLTGLAVSTGAACSSGAPDPSHVLTAIGLTRQEAHQTLRVGIGRFTTAAEVEEAAIQLVSAVRRVRSIEGELVA